MLCRDEIMGRLLNEVVLPAGRSLLGYGGNQNGWDPTESNYRLALRMQPASPFLQSGSSGP